MFNDISLDIFWLYMKYNTRNVCVCVLCFKIRHNRNVLWIHVM